MPTSSFMLVVVAAYILIGMAAFILATSGHCSRRRALFYLTLIAVISLVMWFSGEMLA